MLMIYQKDLAIKLLSLLTQARAAAPIIYVLQDNFNGEHNASYLKYKKHCWNIRILFLTIFEGICLDSAGIFKTTSC